MSKERQVVYMKNKEDYKKAKIIHDITAVQQC